MKRYPGHPMPIGRAMQALRVSGTGAKLSRRVASYGLASRRQIRDGLRYLKYYRDTFRFPYSIGKCDLCGRRTRFVIYSQNYRETLNCLFCGASLRNRLFARQVSMTLGWKGRSFYHTAIALSMQESISLYYVGTGDAVGRVLQVFARRPGVVFSRYDANVPTALLRKGIRNEDLQALTFADGSFDLVLSEDVLEHVRRPYLAWQEIKRVLRSGGRHIFTIGCNLRELTQTRQRVDVSTDMDAYLLPPVYHGTGAPSSHYLVYSDFGIDLLDDLERIGMPTELRVVSEQVPGIGQVEVEVFLSMKKR